MPFSFGHRKCPGEEYALLVAKYFLVRFLQTFPLILPGDGLPYQATTRVGTTIRNGLRLRIYRSKVKHDNIVGAADGGPSGRPGSGQDQVVMFHLRSILAAHDISSDQSQEARDVADSPDSPDPGEASRPKEQIGQGEPSGPTETTDAMDEGTSELFEFMKTLVGPRCQDSREESVDNEASGSYL